DSEIFARNLAKLLGFDVQVADFAMATIDTAPGVAYDGDHRREAMEAEVETEVGTWRSRSTEPPSSSTPRRGRCAPKPTATLRISESDTYRRPRPKPSDGEPTGRQSSMLRSRS